MDRSRQGRSPHAFDTETVLQRALQSRLLDGEWFTRRLPGVLGKRANIRNPAAHTARVNREGATAGRDQLLGVGYQGELVRLANVRLS